MSETFPSLEMVQHIKGWYERNPITRAMQDDEKQVAAEIAAAQHLAYLSDPTNVEDAKAWAEATMDRLWLDQWGGLETDDDISVTHDESWPLYRIKRKLRA